MLTSVKLSALRIESISSMLLLSSHPLLYLKTTQMVHDANKVSLDKNVKINEWQQLISMGCPSATKASFIPV